MSSSAIRFAHSRAIRGSSKKSPAKICNAPSPAKSSSGFQRRSSRRRTRLQNVSWPLPPSRSQHGKRQHGQKNHQQSRRRFQNAALPFRQNRKTPVHKFDVHPIHQQRCIPQLNERAESLLRPSPPAPRIRQKNQRQQDPAAHQEKLRTRVPIIVNRRRIQPHRRGIQQLR